jgi:hypothetical protein
VYCCNNSDEMAPLLRTLLDSPIEARETHIPAIDETACAFEALYGLK